MPSKRKTTATAPDADNPPDVSPAASSNTTSTAAAPAKRQRVSRACDQCRAAREKCDGIQPLCFPCVSQNRPCTYAANPKKRGVQTGYIKTLEVALAWLFDKVPGCEEALDNLLMHEGGQGQNLLVGKDSEKTNRLHKRWRRSKVHREIDRILSGGDASQSRIDKSSPSDDGESDSEQIARTPRTGQASTPSQGLSQPANGRAAKLANALENPALMPRVIQLPSTHWRLLDVYFSYTHCWYPVLERHELLKTVNLYPDQGLDIQNISPVSAAHAELWAALALASYQDAASAKPVGSAPTEESSLSPDEIYNIARSLIPTEEGDFDIQHARALLLLGLINVGKGKKTCAWILVGLAHRIALDVSELYSNDERSSRRSTAVLMGCYILDTLISVHRRGMPSLETAGIIEGMSIPEDNLDEWQPWAPCDGFGANPSYVRTSSRSPAYSLTTFNQLYDVFKFMRKRTLQRQNGLLPSEHPSEAAMLLHQTIKPRLPFANFIVARDSSSVTIPSAYVLRILFLWVSAILDTTDESHCFLIFESIEQYLAQFGPCGAPPFFSSCLAMMRKHRTFGDLHPQNRDKWQVIQDTLRNIWLPAKDLSRTLVLPIPAAIGAARASDGSLPSSTTRAPTNMTSPTPTDLYTPSNMRDATPVSKQYPHQPNTSFIVGGFSPPKPPINTGAVNPSTASTAINMLDAQAIVHGGPGPPLGHSQQMAGRGALIHRESFNAGPLDYDAILEDLSSMDYVDRVDADPQFMANLGFGPGCDIGEILSQEFGAI